MTTRKRRRRFRLRELPRLVHGYYNARRIAIKADLRKFGTDSIKTGFAALILNIWLRNAVLVYAAATAVVLGLAAYLVGVPRNDDDTDEI